LPPHIVTNEGLQSAEESGSEEGEEEQVEDLDVQGTTLSPKDHLTFASELEEPPSPPKSIDLLSPTLGSAWEPRPSHAEEASEDLRVLQGPKFLRRERKTVSLALLAPVARTTAEVQLQKQLFDVVPRDDIGAQVPTAVPVEVDSVADFLRQRRQARGAELPTSPVSGASQAAAVGHMRHLISPLEKSVSLPTLARAV